MLRIVEKTGPTRTMVEKHQLEMQNAREDSTPIDRMPFPLLMGFAVLDVAHWPRHNTSTEPPGSFGVRCLLQKRQGIY